MENVKLTRDLVLDGFAHPELARLARDGVLIRVRRGAYVEGPAPTADARDSHLRLIAGTVGQLGRAATISHVSAAVLHGLPVWSESLTRVHLTRFETKGRVRRYVHLHQAELLDEEVTVLDGYRVTSLARTVVDVGRSSGLMRSVPVADAAMSRGLVKANMVDVVETHRRLHGMAKAQRMITVADGKSESVGESCSRVLFHVNGVPSPTLQREVYDEWGRLIGRSDFCWESQRLLGEFDGKVKYTALLRPGQSASDVVIAEKRREDALRSLGWQVVRWTWDEIFSPEDLLRRLDRALCGRR